jgi:hypothetical protein
MSSVQPGNQSKFAEILTVLFGGIHGAAAIAGFGSIAISNLLIGILLGWVFSRELVGKETVMGGTKPSKVRRTKQKSTSQAAGRPKNSPIEWGPPTALFNTKTTEVEFTAASCSPTQLAEVDAIAACLRNREMLAVWATSVHRPLGQLKLFYRDTACHCLLDSKP